MFKILGLFLTLFTFNSFADVSCISDRTLFMPTSHTKLDNSDDFNKFYVSMKGGDKYMVIASKGPTVLWPTPEDMGYQVILTKSSEDKYSNLTETLTVEVFCQSNELLLKLSNEPVLFLSKEDR